MSRSASCGISLDLRTLLIPCILTARMKEEEEEEEEVVSGAASNVFRIERRVIFKVHNLEERREMVHGRLFCHFFNLVD